MKLARIIFVAALAITPVASASQLFLFSDPNGLSAEAEFTLLNPTTLQIRLKNTSTGVPNGFDSSDQILTGISWDFGHPGYNGDTMITGGSVIIGPTSSTIDFTTGSYGPGFDVSGEYGYGNMDGTGALTNFVSGNAAQGTPFGGPNLDGPANVDGPQGGLVASPLPISNGGLGVIQDEIIATLTLSIPITEAELIQDLYGNQVRVEFGSDAHFIQVPEPASLLLVTVGGMALVRRRR